MFDLYDDNTDLARDQAIAVLAEVGVLYTMLFDSCLFEMPSELILNAPRKVETVSDVVALRFVDALKLASDSDLNAQIDSGDRIKAVPSSIAKPTGSDEELQPETDKRKPFSLKNLC